MIFFILLVCLVSVLFFLSKKKIHHFPAFDVEVQLHLVTVSYDEFGVSSYTNYANGFGVCDLFPI